MPRLADTQAGAGSVHIAARAFMGTAVTASDPSGATFTDTAISNLIAKQHAANPTNLDLPVHYVRGTADYLIPGSEETVLAAATAGTAITYSTSTSPAQHDRLDEVYDFDELEAWLLAAVPPDLPPARWVQYDGDLIENPPRSVFYEGVLIDL